MVRINIYRILSVPVYGLLYFFTAVMVIVGLPFIWFKMNRSVRSMMRFWAHGIIFLMGRKLHISGNENTARPAHFVLVANHSSLFDIIAICAVFPDVSWFGHERLLKIPVFRRVLLLTGYIPMRKATVRNTREMLASLIESSKHSNIAIFPEGTRSVSGKVNDFYRGFIMLLRYSDVDVLPVTLNGFYALKPKTRFYIDFSSRLEVIIHPPIGRELLLSKSDRQIAEQIKYTIESAVRQNPGLSTREIKLKPDLQKI
jgi:1-acyl-sn-glycerol-3-phosphate acyltransferase